MSFKPIYGREMGLALLKTVGIDSRGVTDVQLHTAPDGAVKLIIERCVSMDELPALSQAMHELMVKMIEREPNPLDKAILQG
jgi:hypothetical protein